MVFNNTTIGLLLFYFTGALLLVAILLLALPSVYRNEMKARKA